MRPDPLIFLIWIPVLAGALCLFLPDRLKALTRLFAFSVTIASFFYAIRVFISRPLYWPEASSSVFLVDTLSGFTGIGIAFFALAVTVYSFGAIKNNTGRYFGYVLMTLGSAAGAVYASNLIILTVFWGFLAVTLYLLVNMGKAPQATSAAKKSLVIVGGTDSFLIFGIGLAWAISGTFSMDKMHIPLNGALPFIAFLSILSASLAKAGAMPFHSWVPDAAESAPAAVTAYLPASLDKLLGIYLLARVSLDIFVMNRISNLILLIIGSATIIFAVIFALVQHDLKRLLGYHAVSQVGYMVLGIGTGNAVGIAGGLFHMLNHAVYKSCLFLSGGNVEKSSGTTDLADLGGLAKYMPVTFASFLIASLAISGIPPFNGFVSKWMIYQGIIESAGRGNGLWIIWLTAAMFGSALTLASFMKLIHSIFLGRPSRDFSGLKESPLTMLIPIVILAALCVIFGIFAFTIPLQLFIAPSLNLSIIYMGTWKPLIATGLILAGIIIGMLVYRLTRSSQFRTAQTFVGGEDALSLERVVGTEFYDTIKEAEGLKNIYKGEEEGVFDVYKVAGKSVYGFTRFLQFLHNGILPTYMVWCILGMVGMFLVIFFR